MEGSEPLQLVFDSEFLFFEGRDAGFVPPRLGHFGGDDFFKFFVLNSEILDLPFQFHA